MIKLADKHLCTACGACAAQCPCASISMVEGNDGIVLPHIDTRSCIECHSCEKVCPVLNPPERHNPQQAYAAWSNDEEERRTSASGGIAIEIYKYAISKGWKVVGASQNEDFSVTHKVVSTLDVLPQLKNSKYVFSDAYDAFKQIRSLLKGEQRIVFIGLPCQVAALRKLFRDDENLLLIEVVCHGTTPLSYLRQHIHYLESREGHITKRMSFRDPETHTYTFTFTLYNAEGQRFYAKRTKDGDTYQYGYHRSISYRENCYQCQFASRQRVADITLSDYKGLGKMASCDYTHQKVSCTLSNTTRGKYFIDQLIESGRVHADLRPTEEPITGDPRLREPSSKSKARLDFEKLLSKYNGDFELTMQNVIKNDIQREKFNKILKMSRKVLRKIKKCFQNENRNTNNT